MIPENLTAPPMTKFRKPPTYFIPQLTLALAFAAVLTVLTLITALAQVNHGLDTEKLTIRQTFTIRELRSVESDISYYRRENGKLPQSLTELTDLTGAEATSVSEALYDGWNQPLQYEVYGTRYRLFSFGADGKVGGSDLDADLTAESLPSLRLHFTIQDFLENWDTQYMADAVVVTGLLGGVLCFAVIPPSFFGSRNKLPLVLRLAMTLSASALIAAIVTVIQPTGA